MAKNPIIVAVCSENFICCALPDTLIHSTGRFFHDTCDTLFATGILGNGFVLLVFLKSYNLRRKLNTWYLINQTCIDFLVSVFMLLLTITIKDETVAGISIAAELECR